MRKRSSNLSKSRLWVKLAQMFVIAVAGGTIFLTIIFAVLAKDLPNPEKIVRHEGFSTKIYDRNGKPLYDLYADQRRVPVAFTDMPVTLRQATIAVEDKSFYSHRGFDPLTPLRILRDLIFKRRLVGGSTLTQQLVKMVILSPERTATRKLKEFLLSIQVERKYSKDQILQMYLNEAPYGGTAWGVEAAAEAYFGKTVREINLPESIILAGLPQSPTQYSPYTGKAYISRAYDVARRMREDGYITAKQEEELKKTIPEVAIATQAGLLKAPHFVFYVKQLLESRYGEKAAEQGGLKVITSLDLDLQEAAQKAVTEEINKVKYLNITNGGAIVLDPKNGQILAMVGSRGWDDPNYDGKYNVVTALRQPGSSIKPVTYLAGLRKGYTAATMLMDVKTVFPGGDVKEYIPENYDGKYRGPVLVREALGNSLNIPAVKMLSVVGIKEMLNLAYDMGIADLKPTDKFLSRVGLSVTLGGGEVKLLDMASAYSAFANGGKKIAPVAILKVTDNNGQILEEWRETINAQIISPEEAFIISSILSDPEARSITFGARSAINVAGRTVAVKTGTTNEKKDNWTIGWTPSVLTGVWVGNNNNTAMKEVASGITGAAPIWQKIIIAALGKTIREEFATPSGIVAMDVDRVSGWPAHDGFAAKKEYFIKGTEPTGEDPVHKMNKLCRGEGKLATPADVNGGNYDSREGLYFKESDPFSSNWRGANKWQEGIDNWLKDQADVKYHPPTDYCGSGSSVWVIVQDPQEKSRINSNDVHVKVDVDDVSRVTQIKISIDGVVKHTFTDKPWEITLTNIPDGKHYLDVEATNDKGQTGSRHVGIAINQDWTD